MKDIYLAIKAPSVRYLLISRYVIQEVVLTTCAVLFILLFISLTHAFVGYLADAAQGVLPLSLVLKVLLLNTPFLLSFLMPMAFFFGIILGLGRLYADSEMTALFAGGYGMAPLIKTLLIPGVFMVLLTGMLNFYWAPESMHRLAQTLAAAEQDLLSRLLQPGRFQSGSESGSYAVYIESQEKDALIAHGIFVAQQNVQQASSVIVSKKGYQWIDDDTQDRYIVLENGERYFGRAGEANFQLITFEKYGVRLQQSEAEYRLRERMQSSGDLWRANTLDARAEWQWRLCLSVSIIVLMIFATLLAQLKPRQGKYANALPAILVMIVYTNMLILAKGFVEDGKGIDWLGMYWVVIFGFVIAILWLRHRMRLWPWKRSS